MHQKTRPHRRLSLIFRNISRSCARLLTCVTWAACSRPVQGFPYECREYWSLRPHVWTASSESVCHSQSPALLVRHTEAEASDCLVTCPSLHLSHLYLQQEKSRSGECTVASDVIMYPLVALLANQQQLAEAPAYVQKLFQLTVSEADGQSLVAYWPHSSYRRSLAKPPFKASIVICT